MHVSEAARTAGTPAAALVRVTGVEKTYANGVRALKDVNFTVGAGEFVSLLGPSGCGKSTVLRMIAGLGEPTSGGVLVEDKLPEQARKGTGIAFVFQEATLLPWRTVTDNVAVALELAGVARQERLERAAEALDLVGLSKFGKIYPRQLSGGMRMRVSIARALITRPKLLLMDEPFGALDEMTRQYLHLELLKLCDLVGWTVVFVTHNVFEAVFLSSRILTMTPQPGTISHDIPIHASQARDDDFRGSHEFTDLVRQVTAALHH